MLPAMVEGPDDRKLMLRYKGGDVEAFEMLYTRHKAPLFRYFLRRGLDREKASEMFHEVWIRIIRAKDRYRPAAKFTTYMYQLAHNCYVDQVRLEARAPRNPGAAAAVDPDEICGDSRDDPESRAQAAQSLDNLRRALAGLPAEQCEAFVLREEGGLSLAEIADVTGVNAETAKSRLRYAVKKLRQVLHEPSG